jgi:hypothetical protein
MSAMSCGSEVAHMFCHSSRSTGGICGHFVNFGAMLLSNSPQVRQVFAAMEGRAGVSLPKIISGRSDDAIQIELVWR